LPWRGGAPFDTSRLKISHHALFLRRRTGIHWHEWKPGLLDGCYRGVLWVFRNRCPTLLPTQLSISPCLYRRLTACCECCGFGQISILALKWTMDLPAHQ